MDLISPIAALMREPVLLESNTASVEQTPAVERFTFSIGPHGFAIQAQQTCQLHSLSKLCILPGTPRWLSGITNIRGQLIPVFDVQQFIDEVQMQADNNSHILVFGKGAKSAAVLISELPKRKLFTKAQCLTSLPPVPKSIQDLIQNAYADNNNIWLDLDHLGLLQKLADHIGKTPQSAAA